MGTILKRIKSIADLEGLSITALETTIGASKGVLSRALLNGTDIQSKWIILIYEKFPHYSASWLLTGQKPMLATANAAVLDANQQAYATLHLDKEQAHLATIDAFKETIQTQKEMIEVMKSTIQLLEKNQKTKEPAKKAAKNSAPEMPSLF